MTELIPYVRWIHVLAGSSWLGEVVVINFVLVPALGAMPEQARRDFVAAVFPRIFRLASVLSATTVIAGVILVWNLTGGELGRLTTSRWGLAILAGGGLGIALTLFHFFMEQRMARKIGVDLCGPAPDVALEDVHTKLRLVPRLGLLVITTIFLTMLYAVRGT